MQCYRLITIGLATLVLLGGLGGVGSAAAQEHPACQGEKDTVSAEGTASGSKTITKPVCSDSGDVEFDTHDPDDDLSIPESESYHCHDTSRESSSEFQESTEC